MQSTNHWTTREFPTATAKSLQLCSTLCDPRDGCPPGFHIPGILQARLEWVAISFSNAWKWKVKVKSLSRVRLLVTPWTAAHQAPPPMGFSRQEYWSGLPLPSPREFPGGHEFYKVYSFWLYVFHRFSCIGGEGPFWIRNWNLARVFFFLVCILFMKNYILQMAWSRVSRKD